MAKNFVLLQVFYVIPVRELETRLQLYQEVSSLDYDFLSNVAPGIQDIIENRSVNDILNWINANDSTALLLADTTEASMNTKQLFPSKKVRSREVKTTLCIRRAPKSENAYTFILLVISTKNLALRIE